MATISLHLCNVVLFDPQPKKKIGGKILGLTLTLRIFPPVFFFPVGHETSMHVRLVVWIDQTGDDVE